LSGQSIPTTRFHWRLDYPDNPDTDIQAKIPAHIGIKIKIRPDKKNYFF
jgi:hypothetical protein